MNSSEQQEMLRWTAHQWKDWLASLLDIHYEREIRCGYDEKIGAAAIGELSSAIRNAPLAPPPLELCQLVRAMFHAYLKCDLDGEGSSGRSSMGSVFNDLFHQLPTAYSSLEDEYLWIRQHLSAAPASLEMATNEQLHLRESARES